MYGYFLNGDLHQMYSQMDWLKHKGISVSMDGGIPIVCNEEDYIKALNIIWLGKLEGWWNYDTEFEKYNICSKDEYKIALGV